MATAYRINRIKEQMQREMSDIVLRMKDPRVGHVTVVDAEVNKDLSLATMYVSVLGDDAAKEQALNALQKALGFIRRELAQRIQLRHTPELRVRLDDTTERAARVTALIDRLDLPPEAEKT